MITGVTASLGKAIVPFFTQTGTTGRSVTFNLDSHVEHTPLLGFCSLVLYSTTAIRIWISLGKTCTWDTGLVCPLNWKWSFLKFKNSVMISNYVSSVMIINYVSSISLRNHSMVLYVYLSHIHPHIQWISPVGNFSYPTVVTSQWIMTAQFCWNNISIFFMLKDYHKSKTAVKLHCYMW